MLKQTRLFIFQLKLLFNFTIAPYFGVGTVADVAKLRSSYPEPQRYTPEEALRPLLPQLILSSLSVSGLQSPKKPVMMHA